MFQLISCLLEDGLYFCGFGPVTVHPSCVITPYGVPGGPFVNLSGTVAMKESAPIQTPILLSCIWGKVMLLR